MHAKGKRKRLRASPLEAQIQASSSERLREALDELRKGVSPRAHIAQLEYLSSLQDTSQEDKETTAVARHALALIHLCRKEFALADARLFQLGFRWRLSSGLFTDISHARRYGDNKGIRSGEELGRRKLPEEIRVIDEALPQQCFERLLRGFRKDGPYWRENNYWDDATGYFSYVVDLDEELDPGCGGEKIRLSGREALTRMIQTHILPKVLEQFPQAAGRVKAAEIWAHARDNLSGHQLHYDCDENLLKKQRRMRNPLASTILYLSPGSGGPTVVSMRRAGDINCNPCCWRIEPCINRLVIFDGGLLHGVLPLLSDQIGSGDRLTLMFGFWDDQLQRAGPLGPSSSGFPCASMEVSEKTTWVREFEGCFCDEQTAGRAKENECDSVRFVERLFEPVVGAAVVGDDEASRSEAARMKSLQAEENAEERAVHFVDGFFVDSLDAVDEGLLSALVLDEELYSSVIKLENSFPDKTLTTSLLSKAADGCWAHDLHLVLRLAYCDLTSTAADNLRRQTSEEALVSLTSKSKVAREVIAQTPEWRNWLLLSISSGEQPAVMAAWNIVQFSMKAWPVDELDALRQALQKALPTEPYAAGALAYLVPKGTEEVILQLAGIAEELIEEDEDNTEDLQEVKAALAFVVDDPTDMPQVKALLCSSDTKSHDSRE